MFAEAYRDDLVEAGALPILFNLLLSTNLNTYFAAMAAICNFAREQKYHRKLSALGQQDILKRLIEFLTHDVSRVRPHESFKTEAMSL